MQKFISHIRHSSNTDLFPPQNINKRSYGSLIQKIKCWNVHPAMLPSTSRYPVGGGGGGEIKQIQLKCLAKRKHSVKNKVKFSPNPQDEPYLITSFKSLVVSAWAQLEHVEKIYGILSWLAWGKEEVSLWGQAQEIICFFLQFFNMYFLLLLMLQ